MNKPQGNTGMAEKGEKIGWTGGFSGAFIWILVLSIVFLFQGKLIEGITGLLIFMLGIISVSFFTPWRYPSTLYWKLMVVPYLILLVSIFWSVWSFGGLEDSGLRWWNFLWVLPVFTPLIILGARRWEDRKSQDCI